MVTLSVSKNYTHNQSLFLMTHLSATIIHHISAGTFICPLCQSKLLIKDDKVFCQSASCGYSAEPIPLIGGKIPVLIDFSKTILSSEKLLATGGESLIPRTGNRYDKLKSVFWGSGKKTKLNLAMFMASLPKYENRKATILIIGGGAIGSGASEMIPVF